MALCLKCGNQIVEPWSFCPHCGTAVHAAVRQDAHTASLQEHVPARGAFGGLAVGLVAAPILLIAGTMVCLTGWGHHLRRADDRGGHFCAAGRATVRHGRIQGQMPHVRNTGNQHLRRPELQLSQLQ